jgi:nucleoid-associated protein YgaU
MGFIDFMKDAGEKIFKPGEVRREDAIEKHLASYGISGIAVEVDGDIAALSGTAKDQETREKAVLIAGNIAGIARVNDQIKVAAPVKPATAVSASSAVPAQPAPTPAADAAATAWKSRTYTVQKGDTLSKIAKEMYGNANEYGAIFEANKPMLKDPDKIYPGQVLRIPQQH